MKILISTFSLFIITSCSTHRITHEGLNGTLWVQTSVEYEMAAMQAYKKAAQKLTEALNDSTWSADLVQKEQGQFSTLPAAVILDADETVLDNAPFQARLLEKGIDFDPQLWQEWVREEKAEAIPGAKDFIEFARENKVAVFYVTNRELEEPTLKNIQNVLDPDVDSETLMCKNEQSDWGSDKSTRRAEVAKSHRILLLIGDDYNDFTFLGKADPAERKKLAKKHQLLWGNQWILLPNPLYGSWERALYNYSNEINDNQKLELKYRLLNTKP